MTEVTLTRKQVEDFIQFATNFKDVQWFTIEQDSDSTRVRCSLFGNDSEPETTVIINED